MTSVLGGIGTALIFTTATVCASRSTRMIGPTSVLSWVMLVGFVILGPIVAASGVPPHLQARSFGLLAVAGVTNVLGLLLAYRALRIGQVGRPAPRYARAPDRRARAPGRGDGGNLRGRGVPALHVSRPPRHRRDGRPRVFIPGVVRIGRLRPVPGEAGPTSDRRSGDDRHRRPAARRPSGMSSPAQRARFLPLSSRDPPAAESEDLHGQSTRRRQVTRVSPLGG